MALELQPPLASVLSSLHTVHSSDQIRSSFLISYLIISTFSTFSQQHCATVSNVLVNNNFHPHHKWDMALFYCISWAGHICVIHAASWRRLRLRQEKPIPCPATCSSWPMYAMTCCATKIDNAMLFCHAVKQSVSEKCHVRPNLKVTKALLPEEC